MNISQKEENAILKEVPGQINDTQILQFLHTKEINWRYLNVIKNLTDFNDDILSDWLNVSVKTFRSYKSSRNTFKENVKEQVLLLLSLVIHGIEVFGSSKELDQWLNRENFYFDNKAPGDFLNTVTGIKFVNDRLTAMEYGDNV